MGCKPTKIIKVMLNLIEFVVMRVRFKNAFLFSIGTSLGIGSLIIDNSLPSSIGAGVCFALILLNFLEKNKNA